MKILKPIIRFAKKEDIAQIIDLCEAHAIYKKSNYSKKGKNPVATVVIFKSK